MSLSRRDFLKLLGLSGASLGLGWWPEAAVASEFPVRVTGEDMRLGHLLRDGHRMVAPLPSLQAEVVIVGGGISGLTAAHDLPDANLLVLEKEARLGGHARKGTWRDMTYSEGSAYLVDTTGHVGELLADLRLDLREIREPGDAYHAGKRPVVDFWGEGSEHLPFSEEARRGFRAFMRDLAGMRDLPTLPVERASSAALGLDRQSFGEYLRPYGPEVHRYLDLYCRSALGGPVDGISTYWGLNFLSGEFEPRYTMPGGLAAVGEAIARSIDPARVQTGAQVFRIEPVGDKVRVSYLLGDEAVTVEARAVVAALPKQIAKHVVVGLPAKQRAAMAQMRYEPYLVMNVLLSMPVSRTAYDTWVAGAPFTDVIIADWVNPDPRRRHSVLTVYCPLRDADRPNLLDDRWVQGLGRRVVRSLDALHPGLARHVVEVRAYRRGHAMIQSAPGALTTLRPEATRALGSIVFAHSDSQMAAAIETAIWEGQKSARQVKRILARGR